MFGPFSPGTVQTASCIEHGQQEEGEATQPGPAASVWCGGGGVNGNIEILWRP